MKPSVPSPSRTPGQAVSWELTTGGGTTALRARLRALISLAGTSKITAKQGRPAAVASSRYRARWPASSPTVSMTVVRRRPNRRSTTVSSSANASLEAAMSCSPSPTSARSPSLDTTW